MAHAAYVSFKGQIQGQFKSETTKPSRLAKWSEVVAFGWGMEAPHDAGSGQASGKRQHQPITITKQFGSATPQLFQACVTNEVFSEVVLEVVDPDLPGPDHVVRRIILNDAVIRTIIPHTGHLASSEASSGETGPMLNDVTFTYQRINDEQWR